MTPRIEQGRRANLRPKAAGVRASVYVMGERRSTHENCGLCACVAHLESGMRISNMRFDLRKAASLYRPSGNRAPAASTCIPSTYRWAALLCWPYLEGDAVAVLPDALTFALGAIASEQRAAQRAKHWTQAHRTSAMQRWLQAWRGRASVQRFFGREYA